MGNVMAPSNSSGNIRKPVGRKRSSNHKIELDDAFTFVNEHPVHNISFQFLYKPYSITLLGISIPAVFYLSIIRDGRTLDDNIWSGLLCMIYFFLVLSVLTFPNGPFTRPHPAMWRIFFGCSVLYLLLMQFFLFQDHETIRSIFYWLDPELQNFHINMEKQYGENCSNVNFERIIDHLDIFALGHILGWAFKALMLRDASFLWALSVTWEITEMCFAHLLPNFVECWWDALLLDVVICNGAGIWFGLKLCKMLEMREYKWTSVKDISTTSGKIKRVMLQFTPESWTAIRWMGPKSTSMRFATVGHLIVFFQISELNTFFLKHVFEMPPGHYLVVGRLIFIGLIAMPAIRQYYSFVTDPRCKRIGTQCWVFIAITVSESLLCIKNGKGLFEKTDGTNIVFWLIVQAILSVLFVCACIKWQREKNCKKIN